MKRTKKKNPLHKRVPRELKQDIGKYLALLLFLTLTIGIFSAGLIGILLFPAFWSPAAA